MPSRGSLNRKSFQRYLTQKKIEKNKLCYSRSMACPSCLFMLAFWRWNEYRKDSELSAKTNKKWNVRYVIARFAGSQLFSGMRNKSPSSRADGFIKHRLPAAIDIPFECFIWRYRTQLFIWHDVLLFWNIRALTFEIENIKLRMSSSSKQVKGRIHL